MGAIAATVMFPAPLVLMTCQPVPVSVLACANLPAYINICQYVAGDAGLCSHVPVLPICTNPCHVVLVFARWCQSMNLCQPCQMVPACAQWCRCVSVCQLVPKQASLCQTIAYLCHLCGSMPTCAIPTNSFECEALLACVSWFFSMPIYAQWC